MDLEGAKTVLRPATVDRLGLAGAAAVAVALALLVASPAWASHEPPSPTYPITQFLDVLSGPLISPDPTGAVATPPYGGNSRFMPDWNRDGTFGDAGDFSIENSPEPATAPFPYPCIGVDGKVTYEVRGGGCVPGDTPGAPFRTGNAIKTHLIDSLGNRMAATLFLPRKALRLRTHLAHQSARGPHRRAHQRRHRTRRLPGVVIAQGGLGSPMQAYYMYSMTLARAGLIALSFDFAGQGQSEGTPIWPGNLTGPPVEECGSPRSCRETQDAVRWLTGRRIVQVAHQGPDDPAYAPRGDNPRNPALRTGVLNPRKVGLMGQSHGSLTVSNYLYLLAKRTGADGRPLPPIKAAIGLSSVLTATRPIVVPYQMQTADLDIPGPGLGESVTDGSVGTKAYYDSLRDDGEGSGPLELIILESGSHGDTSNVTVTPYARWSPALSTGYARNWMSCNLAGNSRACRRAVRARPHLSRAVASEHDPDGASGPSPSRCITIPDRATLGQAWHPDAFAAGVSGHPPYDCKR